MKPTTRLFFLLPLLSLVMSSCSMGSPSERKSEEFVLRDGTKVKCYMPPPDVIAKGEKANVELTVLRLGKLLEATAGGSLDVERIRQELPPEVSTFEVVEFRICAQYGNGVFSKQAYQAFTEQIIPAYSRNPPTKTVPVVGTPASALVEVCGPSFMTKRPASKFVPYWATYITRLSEDRNIQHHDLQNLLQVRGRIPVEAAGIDPFEEINFTLECLERIGYLKTEKIAPPNNLIIGTMAENRKIIFLKPSKTFP
jgi:hypothetical protein